MAVPGIPNQINNRDQMHKKLLLTSLAAMTLCGVSAKHLTPQEALSRAVSQPVNGIQKAPANAASMEIRQVLHNPVDAATVYVFASDGNALVVPADDRVAPVLGYIDGCANGEILWVCSQPVMLRHPYLVNRWQNYCFCGRKAKKTFRFAKNNITL